MPQPTAAPDTAAQHSQSISLTAWRTPQSGDPPPPTSRHAHTHQQAQGPHLLRRDLRDLCSQVISRGLCRGELSGELRDVGARRGQLRRRVPLLLLQRLQPLLRLGAGVLCVLRPGLCRRCSRRLPLKFLHTAPCNLACGALSPGAVSSTNLSVNTMSIPHAPHLTPHLVQQAPMCHGHTNAWCATARESCGRHGGSRPATALPGSMQRGHVTRCGSATVPPQCGGTRSTRR